MCLSAVRLGFGQPLVLLHGWGSSSRVWRKLSLQLARQFQTIAFDLPGFGFSDPVERVAVSRLSERLLRGIDGRFVVLGWSLGGLIALDMTRRAPERVAGIVLIATNPCFTQRRDWPHAIEAGVFESFAHPIAAAPARALKRFAVLQASNGARRAEVVRELQAAAAWTAPDSRVLLATLRLLSQSDMRQVLVGLHCPVALVLGEKDVLVPAAIRGELAALAPRLCCYVVAGAAHAPFLSHPMQIAAYVKGFLL